MPQYMLLMYQPAEGGPRKADGSPVTAPEDWAAERKRWDTYVQDLTDAGALVANHGLSGTDAATTVRVRDGETAVTDGPDDPVLAGYQPLHAAHAEMLRRAGDRERSGSAYRRAIELSGNAVERAALEARLATL